ncbi:DUF2190 family protein [Gordonia desulfuricans]|uniref:DUF2190 family protein n=1 Tax=Gordonia desulfuricans TaxID=89051 RepID=A0A7K3LS03_9ACTN|nr:capsid cement protein [Gordonia desulfuricans]NDK91043.1 DUF2190 family protein [Gordonia desulfuricans]
MAEFSPLALPGTAQTFTASAAVTAGQVVEITGARTVAPTSAASAKVYGVALFDAANGAKVTVSSGGVYELAASGAIAAGALVVSAASGAVATIGSGTFDQAIGIAESAAASNKVRVKLFR